MGIIKHHSLGGGTVSTEPTGENSQLADLSIASLLSSSRLKEQLSDLKGCL
jgi:hypothetical protein